MALLPFLTKERIALRDAHGRHIVQRHALLRRHLQLGVDEWLARVEVDALLDTLGGISRPQGDDSALAIDVAVGRHYHAVGGSLRHRTPMVVSAPRGIAPVEQPLLSVVHRDISREVIHLDAPLLKLKYPRCRLRALQGQHRHRHNYGFQCSFYVLSLHRLSLFIKIRVEVSRPLLVIQNSKFKISEFYLKFICRAQICLIVAANESGVYLA